MGLPKPLSRKPTTYDNGDRMPSDVSSIRARLVGRSWHHRLPFGLLLHRCSQPHIVLNVRCSLYDSVHALTRPRGLDHRDFVIVEIEHRVGFVAAGYLLLRLLADSVGNPAVL